MGDRLDGDPGIRRAEPLRGRPFPDRLGFSKMGHIENFITFPARRLIATGAYGPSDFAGARKIRKPMALLSVLIAAFERAAERTRTAESSQLPPRKV